ncbi:acid protease [Panus rudis PR-1116 ss-1]|nr:acid protease [Panus rudis PR-1116 ss-1]
MMHSSFFTLFSLFISYSSFVSAIPLPISIRGQETRRAEQTVLQERTGLTSTAGVGDIADLIYTVAIQLGNTTTQVILDTGSSDLWIKSDACKTEQCDSSASTPYAMASARLTGADVNLKFGDSTTGTHASGPVVQDTVALAGLSLPDQVFAAINDTDNNAARQGTAGLIGFGFPSQSFVQAAVVNKEFDTPPTTDAFVTSTAAYGPFLSRLAMSGQLAQPMFSVSFQRNVIDVSGNGNITIGELPPGVDNSSITWVPVRLYHPNEGGQNPPTFAPNEVYPLRWEIPLDGVFLDGQKLPDTNLTGNVPSKQLSALIDTGNSLIRGPKDVVNGILSSVSSKFAADQAARPIFPCATAHNLTFQIGGKMFPIDPRDFVSAQKTGDATDCVADNVVTTDPPSIGALYSWSLGDPFFKSNTVVFYYGNLTHPSSDPPRIGFISNVPQNANDLLQEAVSEAKSQGGVFESTQNLAPTASTTISVQPTSLAPFPTATPKDRLASPSASSSATSASACRYSIFILPLLSYMLS